MRKKKKDFLRTIKEDIINNTKSYFIMIVIFTVGIFLGVLFINKTSDTSDIEKYINTYIDEIRSIENRDYFIELQTDIKNNVVLVFLLWFSGTTIIGIPIVLGIILFRGFCLGYTIGACVYILGKIKAIGFIFLTIVLQNIIFIPSIIILGVSSIKLYKSIIKDRRKENIKLSIVKHSIVSIIILISLVISSVIKVEVSYRLISSFIKYF